MTFGLAVFSMQSYNLSAADSNRESSGEADLGARFDAASGGRKQPRGAEEHRGENRAPTR